MGLKMNCEMALRVSFRADIGAIFRDKKILSNCHPGGGELDAVRLHDAGAEHQLRGVPVRAGHPINLTRSRLNF